jgi:uncharacterized membrane protein
MFSIKESFKYGWQKLKEHMELVLYATLLILAVSSLTGAFSGRGHSVAVPLFNVIATIFLIIVRIGYTKIFLKMHDGEKPKFVEIFEHYKTFWRYLGVSILLGLVTVGGLILLIIPGIFWAVKFSFSPIIVVDAKTGPIAAMKESYAITKGSFWKVLLLWVVIILLNLLGLILFYVGLLITIPLSAFASIYVYRKLSKEKAGIMQNPSPQTA